MAHSPGFIINDAAAAPSAAQAAAHDDDNGCNRAARQFIPILRNIPSPDHRGTMKFTQNINVTTAQCAGAPYIVVNVAEVLSTPQTGPEAAGAGLEYCCIKDWNKACWNLKEPSLLISVTGGAQDFALKARLKDMFTKGLTMAAKNTAAWIVTGGADAGVMSYVGEAFRHIQSSGNSVPIIGIAPFRKMINYRQLKVHGTSIQYSRGDQKNSASSTAIEPNHTHFIFVDHPPDGQEDYDGNEGWGTEIPLRAAFEAEVIKEFKIPSVLILVEGGPNTITTVYEALKSNKTARVVIIEKSGRSADVIPLWKRIKDAKGAGTKAATKGAGTEAPTKEPCTEAPTKGPGVEAATKEPEAAPGYALTSDEQSLLETFKNREKELDEITGTYWSHVSVFNMHQNDNFEDFLYGVILEGVSDFKSKVELTTEWRSTRMLKEVIKDHLNKTSTTDLMTLAKEVSPAVQKALLLNAHPSFSILMDYGMIEQVDLRELYMDSYKKEESLWKFVDKHRATNGKMAEPMSPNVSGDQAIEAIEPMSPNVSGDQAIEAILVALHDTFPDMFHRECDHRGKTASKLPATTASLSRIESGDNLPLPPEGHTDAIDIILWALLNRHMDLALCIWRHSDMPIHCALYASKICQELAEKLEEEPIIQKEYLKVAESFEDLAVKVLDEYSSDDRAIQALEHPWARLKKPEEKATSHGRHGPQNIPATAMSLAVSATAKKFISSQHYQTSLQRKWIAYEEQDTKVRYELHDDNHWQLFWWTLVFFFYPVRWMVKITDPSQPQEILPPGKAWAPDHRLISPFYHIPIVKFWTDTLLWMFFLMYMVAIAFTAHTTHIAWYEIVFYYWLGMLFLNEGRQTYLRGRQTYRRGRKKVRGFMKKLHMIHHLFPDFWNKLDVINYLTFTLWMALRIACSRLDSDRLRRIAHEVLLPAIAMSFVRILNVFSVFPKFGPLLVTVGKMVTDIVRFMCLMLVFLLAFAVIFAVITREWIHMAHTGGLPSDDPSCRDEESMEKACGDEWRKAYPYGTGTLAYWSIMGEFGESFRYMQGTKLGCAMLGIYVLIAQILLINLLIAMMSDTYGKVRDNSDREWKMARFNVIVEFIDSSEIPPPFTLLGAFKAWSWLRSHCKGRAHADDLAPMPGHGGEPGATDATAPMAARNRQAFAAPNSNLSCSASDVANASGNATGNASKMLNRSGTMRPPTLHQVDKDIGDVMRGCKQTMLEQQDEKERRSVEFKVSSVEQDIKSLQAQQQKDHEEVEKRSNLLQSSMKRSNLLQSSMLDELKKLQAAGMSGAKLEEMEQRLVTKITGMSDAKLEEMEQRIVKKIEDMLANMLIANQAAIVH
eukprot:jgi/Mesvir1/5492/Mv15537-RA.3